MSRRLFLPLALALALTGTSCRTSGECTAEESDADRWAALCRLFDDAGLATRHATFRVGTVDGPAFTWTRGDIGPDTAVDLASASKWWASATLLSLVEEGVFPLEQPVHEVLPALTEGRDDPRAAITFGHLLSFTSGINVRAAERSCAGDADTTLRECALQMADESFATVPGEAFFYGPAHLHLAAAAAEEATAARWADLFREKIAAPLEMGAEAAFVLPSGDNPRVGGGARGSLEDYERFLLALLQEEILPVTREALFADWTPSGRVELAHTPVADYGYEWHYGLGHWLECEDETFTEACAEQQIHSSPGAFGFHPWIDRQRGIYGILAVERPALVLPAGDSAELMFAARPLIKEALGR